MGITKVNEGSAKELDFEFRDSDNVLEVPTTVHYRVDCLTTGAAIRASTAVSAASSGTIDLLPADTTLEDQEHESELRLVTVTLDASLDTQFIETSLYEVMNLYAVT